jgi:anthranilate synthase component 2
MTAARVLVLDHKDSFAFLLGEQFARRGAEVTTLRADLALPLLHARLSEYAPHLVVLSPGPGRPEDAATTITWLRERPPLPVLGVCLGHQAMAVACGGEVGRAPFPAHGVATPLVFSPDPLFAGLPARGAVGRYHSLVVTRVPDGFAVLARTDDAHALPMAMRHRRLPWLGLQFHPESVLTPYGGVLVQRVLQQALAARGAAPTVPDPIETER